MFDLMGIASRARVKALEEALEVERARNVELTKQVVLMSDRRSMRLNERPAANRVRMEPKATIRRPMEYPNSAAVISEARAGFRKA